MAILLANRRPMNKLPRFALEVGGRTKMKELVSKVAQSMDSPAEREQTIEASKFNKSSRRRMNGPS